MGSNFQDKYERLQQYSPVRTCLQNIPASQRIPSGSSANHDYNLETRPIERERIQESRILIFLDVSNEMGNWVSNF